jgi:DUF1680 family protein
MLYSPAILTTTINGQPVVISLETEYPWGDTMQFTIKTGINFPFYLRIPEWSNSATVQVNNGKPTPVQNATYYVTQVLAGTPTVVDLTLPMSFYVSRRYNNAASIYYGPILLALNIPANWTQLAIRPLS